MYEGSWHRYMVPRQFVYRHFVDLFHLMHATIIISSNYFTSYLHAEIIISSTYFTACMRKSSFHRLISPHTCGNHHFIDLFHRMHATIIISSNYSTSYLHAEIIISSTYFTSYMRKSSFHRLISSHACENHHFIDLFHLIHLPIIISFQMF
jgi:hypothetical protein